MKILEMIENVVEADLGFYTIQTGDGDYHKMKDGSVEDETGNKFYDYAVFIPKSHATDFKTLDGMLDHFGGFGKVRVVGSNTTLGFQYFSDKEQKWVPVNRVVQGKEVRFTLPYVKDPTRENPYMLLFNQNGKDGTLESWKHSFVSTVIGGDYARSTPYSDPKKKF